MMDILKAKSEAIDAMLGALENRINEGEIRGLAEARSFLSTWQAAVNEMVPLEAYKAYQPADEREPMIEPTQVGARVVDADGDIWQRRAVPEDRPWGLVQRGEHLTGLSRGGSAWEDVLRYNPRPA